jgi:hypothetical protein
MAPVGLDYHPRKGDVVVHRCVRCGTTARNRAAPDDIDALLELATRLSTLGARAGSSVGRAGDF